MINESRVSQDKGDEVILSGQKNLGDKLREMKLAIELEKRYSKDQILEGYLKSCSSTGTPTALKPRRGTSSAPRAKDLTLPQAALLAGLVNSPSYYNPAINPENSLERRNQVLDKMLKLGKITQAEHDAAVATGVETERSNPGRQGCAGGGPWHPTSATTSHI